MFGFKLGSDHVLTTVKQAAAVLFPAHLSAVVLQRAVSAAEGQDGGLTPVCLIINVCLTRTKCNM